MTKPFKNIRTRLTVSVSILFLAVIAAVLLTNLFGIPWTGYQGRFQQRRLEAFRQLSLVADLKKSRLLQLLEDQKTDVRVSATNEMMVNEILHLQAESFQLEQSGLTGDALEAKIRGFGSYGRIQDYLDKVKLEHGVHTRIDVAAGRSGRILVSTDPWMMGRDVYDEHSFRQSFLTPGHYIGRIQVYPQGRAPVLPIVHAIRDPNGSPVAVLMEFIDADVFFKPLLQTGEGLGESGEALLVDNEARILTSLINELPDGKTADPLRYQITAKPALMAARGEEGTIEDLDYRGVPVMAAYRHIQVSSDHGWGLVVKEDRSELFYPLRKDIVQTAWIGLAGIAALLILTALWTARFTRPIRELGRMAVRVSEGELSVRAPIETDDEVGDLAATFNSMLEKLGAWRQELETEVKARTAELDEKNRILRAEIGERERAEESLAESEKMFRQLAESVSEVFWLGSTDWRDIYYISPAYEEVWGRSTESFYKKPTSWAEALHEEDRPRVLAYIREIQKTGQFRHVFPEYRVIRPDGEVRWLSTRSSPVWDETGEFVRIAVIAVDITERKLAEAEREALEDQLRQSQKMEAIGTLAGGIAHDFNNILAAILGYTELSLLDLPTHSKIRDNLEQIQTAGTRAKNLVQQILAFSRKALQEKKAVDLAPIVIEGLTFLRATIPTTVDIRSNVKPGLGMVLADTTQIQQVLLNLCSNAAQAMEDRGGVLTVELEPCPVQSPLSGPLGDIEPGSYLKLSIADNGSGMSRATMERIFEPFFSTKGPGAGTGMGLAVVHGIVRSHGGGITIESRIGTGSVFNVYLPTLEGSEFEQPEEAELSIVQGSERILFVDDEADLVDIGKRMLERLGYHVTALTSSRKALELFRQRPEVFDLVITDLTMPEMDGLSLAGTMNNVRPDLPIILCSGYASPVVDGQLGRRGIGKVLGKPLSAHELAVAIRDVLDNAGG